MPGVLADDIMAASGMVSKDNKSKGGNAEKAARKAAKKAKKVRSPTSTRCNCLASSLS